MSIFNVRFLAFAAAFAVSELCLAQQWVPIGTNTSDCQVSYRTPVSAPSAGRLRFWVQFECNSDSDFKTNGGASVVWRVSQDRVFLNCRSETYWTEASVYFDARGKQVHSWRPRPMGLDVDGPTMEGASIGAEFITPDSMYRKVMEKYCK